MTSYDPSNYWIAPSRNFRTSARLHLQHLLFQNTINNLILDPRILPSIASPEASGRPLRVADIACGNGIWLADLERHLTNQSFRSFQLDGYDINPVNFPPAYTLPESLSFHALDVLAPLADELVGSYDIVHIRAFTSIVRDNDPSPIINQALTLLRPGGWLQWEETRADSWAAVAPREVSKTACETIIHMLDAGGRARGSVFDFIGELGSHFTKAGLRDVEFKQHDMRPVDFKAWTEDYLLVWEELPALFPSKAQAPDAPVTKESFTALFAKAVAETEEGVVLHQQKIAFASGRKAL